MIFFFAGGEEVEVPIVTTLISWALYWAHPVCGNPFYVRNYFQLGPVLGHGLAKGCYLSVIGNIPLWAIRPSGFLGSNSPGWYLVRTIRFVSKHAPIKPSGAPRFRACSECWLIQGLGIWV